jgi:predicted O-linked N-acetylglucosamine transferase (SPINDLY family)
MYQQMGVGGLVAESEEHYVALASQLLSNSSHREATAALVYRAFRRRLHRNNDVAREWRRFIERLFV